ncbi:hypothetical protein Tco_0829100 [Tanacetum coccineum]
MNKKNYSFDLETFRDMLQIYPNHPGQKFVDPPFEEEILAFIRELGYSGNVKSLSDVKVETLTQPWRTFGTIINKCLSGKVTGLDLLRPSRAQILWEGRFKTKYVRRSTREKTDQAPKASPSKRLKATAKVATSRKKKLPAQGLETLLEIALSEAEQMKIATKRSKTQFHSSHASGSGADKGTGVSPGVPDVPTYGSEDEQISWKSSDDDGDDDNVSDSKDDDDNVDNEDDDGQDDDNEQTESDSDGKDFVHPKRAGSNRGSKRRRVGKEPELTSAPKEKASKSSDNSKEGSKSHHTSTGNTLARNEDPHESFNELMDHSLDSQAFVFESALKVDTLTPELLTVQLRVDEEAKTYATLVDKTKAANYGHIKWIEDFVPNSMWSQVPIAESARDVYSKQRILAVKKLKIVEWHNYKYLDWITVRRNDNKLYTFKEGDYNRLCLQNIEDMLLLLVQGKLTNLNVKECLALGVSLRCLQEALSLEGFSDGTLKDVRSALDDILKRIRMEYLSQTVWRNVDRERAGAMIQAINRQLRNRRIEMEYGADISQKVEKSQAKSVKTEHGMEKWADYANLGNFIYKRKKEEKGNEKKKDVEGLFFYRECMRTRSQARRLRQHQRQQQQVPLNLVEPPKDTMADNRTMAELLQAPTEGYEDAIVVPEIAAANFEIKHGNGYSRKDQKESQKPSMEWKGQSPKSTK